MVPALKWSVIHCCCFFQFWVGLVHLKSCRHSLFSLYYLSLIGSISARVGHSDKKIKTERQTDQAIFQRRALRFKEMQILHSGLQNFTAIQGQSV